MFFLYLNSTSRKLNFFRKTNALSQRFINLRKITQDKLRIMNYGFKNVFCVS